MFLLKSRRGDQTPEDEGIVLEQEEEVQEKVKEKNKKSYASKGNNEPSLLNTTTTTANNYNNNCNNITIPEEKIRSDVQSSAADAPAPKAGCRNPKSSLPQLPLGYDVCGKYLTPLLPTAPLINYDECGPYMCMSQPAPLPKEPPQPPPLPSRPKIHDDNEIESYTVSTFLKYKKQVETRTPKLLLSYIYFLNAMSTVAMSVGFDSVTFKPTILLQAFGRSHIVINILDWMYIGLNREAAEKFFTHDPGKPVFINGTNLTIKPILYGRKRERYILLKNTSDNCTHQEIALSVMEWSILMRLCNFFSTIGFHLHRGSGAVQEYFNNYVAFCVAKRQKRLTTRDFFVPVYESENATFNFSRLFYEIPVICREELKHAINTYKFNIPATN